MITLKEIEEALDNHRLLIRMKNGNNWRVRRSGKTKLWKTRPDDFRIPIKYGLKFHAYIRPFDIPIFDMAFVIAKDETE